MPSACSGGRRAALLLAFVLAGHLAAAAPAAALEVPYLTGRVNDLADMVDAETEQRLEARLAALEEATGAQVALLTVPSLEGEALEDYSLRVAETWKLGRQGVDDGVLFLVARDDRKMRFEVGYGLEGTLPDALAGRILDGAVRPRFRDGDFSGGVEAGVEAVAGVIEGDPEALPPERVASPGGGGDATGSAFMVLLIFITVIFPFSSAALFTKGCSGWFLYLALAAFFAVFPISVFGLPWGAVPVVAWLLIGGLVRLLFAGRRGDGLRERYPWLVGSGGGGGGWSSGGGGFSGGGFSGGGGSFGGGGASSSW